MSEIKTVPTPLGDGRVYVARAVEPTAVLLYGHGAGGGVDAWDMAALARMLPSVGVSVVRFEQPWRTAGKKVAPLGPKLDQGWEGAVEWLKSEPELGGLPMFFGGRSAGARVACRTASIYGAVGVAATAFPLHLPGKPEKSRLSELLMPDVPRLILQGERDTFGGSAELITALEGQDDPAQVKTVQVITVPNADHSLKVPKASDFTQAEAKELVVTSIGEFCLR